MTMAAEIKNRLANQPAPGGPRGNINVGDGKKVGAKSSSCC